jgi:hypothetical protein
MKPASRCEEAAASRRRRSASLAEKISKKFRISVDNDKLGNHNAVSRLNESRDRDVRGSNDGLTLDVRALLEMNDIWTL